MNRPNICITIQDIQRFIGILLFTGYHSLPQERMYWSNDSDISIPIIRDTMTQLQFRNLKYNIHLADNTKIDIHDRFYKVRPYINILNNKFQQFGIFKHHLSIDEQMIPYRGRHSCKMFIKEKPIRFGYKSWILASSDGYVFSFDIYQGKRENKYEYGLGGNVIIKLLKALQKPNYHKIYFDNFFTSFKLLSYLKQMGYFATGTVRDNRIEHCPVKSIKVVAKKERGYYDYRFEKLNEIFVVRWNDNSVVTVASTCHTISLLSNVSRYSKKISSKIKIPKPNMVTAYNKHMGGVDLCDNLISTYRIKIRGKKWWWPIFTNFIDVALVNSWKIWKFVNRDDKKSLLAFRREVTNYLLRSQ
ncbi:piggyBac transposable element-derived protein 3-like [Gordionus sp. m RMFG-2023]|uniref:piggyBac transposable element-derived protein 3-like n=1 Tax=Gordionus sp. m RMFG-2023 TaxID=3053472 RepID=UPI0031FD5686